MHHEVHAGEVRGGFRGAAAHALEQHAAPIDCQTTWQDLIAGKTCVVDDFITSKGSVLILMDHADLHGCGLSGRSLEILEQVLLGMDQKVVAIERKLSPSTIATCLRQAYGKMGLNCKPSCVPLLLVMLVHAAKGRGRMEAGRASAFEHQGRTFRVLSLPMPDQVFDRLLSPAEEEVVRMRVQGSSHAEIAARRRTSVRTVANQLATAFQRLGVSSRSDLMELLIVPSNPTFSRMRDLHAQRNRFSRERGRMAGASAASHP